MLNYLKVSGAPAQLVQMAEKYKLQLWRMKDGVLTSKHLRELPLTLQMELIFDINVAHFHNTLLFRDASKKLLLIFKKLQIREGGQWHTSALRWLIHIHYSCHMGSSVSGLK